MSGSEEPPRRLTARGAATKARILASADTLMYERGVAATTLADVRSASSTSKSQLYQHFPDKDALVNAVIGRRGEDVLAQQRQSLQGVDTFRGLELWRDELVERNAVRNGAYGCPLGSLANELADRDESARLALARHFDDWVSLLTQTVTAMKDRGVLRGDADAGVLAGGLLAALQGGYLLAQTARDVRPMRSALDMAISQVRTFAAAAPAK